MNVGFRPRLRAHPSLYDLIAYRSIERLSVGASPPIAAEDLPPLPVSATASPVSPSPEPVKIPNREPEAQPATMAPKKAAKPARDVEAEEQHGEWQHALAAQKHPANWTLQVPSTQSQGILPASRSWTASHVILTVSNFSNRPVVVAENMIGVAMYELVGNAQHFSRVRLTQPRFK